MSQSSRKLQDNMQPGKHIVMLVPAAALRGDFIFQPFILRHRRLSQNLKESQFKGGALNKQEMKAAS